MVTLSLPSSFLSAFEPAVREKLSSADFARLLQDRCTAAHAAWPGVTVPEPIFGAFLAQRVATDREPLVALQGLRAEELLLTCACGRGDERAIKLVETHYFPILLSALRRMRLETMRIEEIKQMLRAQLFAGDQTHPPRILQYSGRGDLGSWLSVSAVRAAYKLMRRESRETPNEDERLLELSTPDSNVEIGYTKETCRSLFRESFKEALTELTDREKNLLRQHYLDELTLDQLCAQYSTHRSTMARWLATARRGLLDATRAIMSARLNVASSECESIIQAAQSRLDMTFHQLLATEG
jgi:RNA polymerase sigma-70 factor (ECF subfamily)